MGWSVLSDDGLLDEGPSSGTFDATPYLTVLLVMLFGISARQIVGPLGAIGQPALLVATGAGLLWLTTRVLLPRGSTPPPAQPLKWALFVYVWYELATIAMAHARPMSTLEQSSSARAAFTVLSMVGLSLLILDGIHSMDRLHVFLRRLTLAAGFLALIGLLQFLFGGSFQIDVPFLSSSSETAVNSRYAFNRPMGTALHPIEFGVVLAALLPLALYFAFDWRGGTKRQHQVSVGVALLMAFTVPLSISRSAIVALVSSMFIMWIGWDWRRRVQALIIAAMWLPLIYLTVPGLLGTFRSLFSTFDSDPSVTARVDRIPIVMELIKENPFFGMGAGTVTPEDDLLLDNQVWGTILATGIVGFVIFLGLLVLTMVMAITSQHHQGGSRQVRLLGFSIAAAIFGLAMSFTTFDALFFRILKTTLFILIGVAGVLWRLTRDLPDEDREPGSAVAESPPTARPRQLTP